MTDKATFAGIYPPIATPFGDDGEVATLIEAEYCKRTIATTFHMP